MADHNSLNPAWPEPSPVREHPITEITSSLAGASSPWGDDMVFPHSPSKTGYVHPYTRINKD